jgi:hypothetical protein
MTGETPNARASDEIDENLRRVFRQMEQSDLPDRFTNLLEQLRARDGASQDDTESTS